MVSRARGGGFAAVIAVMLAIAPEVSAKTTQPALWLGPIGKASESKFTKNGVAVEAVNCAPEDTPCVTAAIGAAAKGGPRVLIAPTVYTATVLTLYNEGLSQDTVSGVVLMNPLAAEISLPKVAAGASALLVLVEETQSEQEILAASLLTRALEAQGAFARLRFVDQGMLKLEAIHRGTVLNVLHFTGGAFPGGDPNVELLKLIFDAEFTWPTLPPHNRRLREQSDFLSTRPMSDAVKGMLTTFYRYKPHMVHQWSKANYDSFDLTAYRDRIAPGARYVVLRNRVGMVFVLDLDVYGAYEPEIVVGVDDEPNMFRLAWFYRTNIEYSWRGGTPKLSARPLGPFLSFRKPLPDDLRPPEYPVMALHLGGIEFTNENPFAAIAAYPAVVQDVITKDNQCIFCHQIEGRGGKAHHLEAMTAQPQGGHALPLSAYPEEVMRSFVFDQEAVAAKFGVTPNAVDSRVGKEFFTWTRSLPGQGAQ